MALLGNYRLIGKNYQFRYKNRLEQSLADADTIALFTSPEEAGMTGFFTSPKEAGMTGFFTSPEEADMTGFFISPKEQGR